MHPFAYRSRFLLNRLAAPREPSPGFSIVVATYNRCRFLDRFLTAVVAATERPFEVIVCDNASADETGAVVAAHRAAGAPIRYVRLERNLGTNAYALGFLKARHAFLVDADDDVLALARGWDHAMEQAFASIPRLGFCALDVVQDRYTNGAKPGPESYREHDRGGTRLLEGPTGGWFACTPRRLHDRLGGFIYRPAKAFQSEDGVYSRRVQDAGYRCGLLKGVYAYHACGPVWNAAFGYHGVWKQKYAADYPQYVGLVDGVSTDNLPDLTVPERALEQAQRSSAGVVHGESGADATPSSPPP